MMKVTWLRVLIIVFCDMSYAQTTDKHLFLGTETLSLK
jgi:hypothetical protein